MRYPVETFTEAERARLAPHFTNLDEPVFALVDLPETVKGALFARYSRYQGTLRRLFLDEFADSLPAPGAAWDGDEGRRAAELYERIFVGYGDDSVAQLGGAHIACEWVSNVLTKILQRPRLGAYLEQSTRYIAYDAPMPGGGYRYYRDDELGPEYERAMDEVFAIYARALPRVIAWVEETYPAPDGGSPAAHARAVQAKALDLLRGLLPAASLSHMGIFATGQTYEQLILHLLAHPLPEARDYGRMLLEHDAGGHAELRRARRAARARRRVGRVPASAASRRRARWVARLGLDREPGDDGHGGPSVTLLHVDGDEDDAARVAAVRGRRRRASASRARASPRSASSSAPRCSATSSASARNRRHRPGRGFEALRYRFEIVSDYGAFRDLQRHRLLTVQWQALGPAARRRRARGGRGGRRRRRLPPRARGLARRVRAPAAAGHERRGALRAVPRLPHPLRARPQRARGDAPHRAALRATRAIPATAPSRTRCTARSSRCIPPSRRRCATSTRRPSRGSSGSSARCARRPSSDALAG